MESRQRSTQSVMARLMGLDELPQPNKSTSQKLPQQMISQTYLQRIASIGVGKNRLLYPKANLGFSVHTKPQSSSELRGSSKFVDSQSNLPQRKRKSLFSRDHHDLQGNTKASKSPCITVSHIHPGTPSPMISTRQKSLRYTNERSDVLKPIHGESKSSERYFTLGNCRVGVEQKERNTVGLSLNTREILEEISRRTRQRVTKGSSPGFRVDDTYAIKPEFSTPLCSEKSSGFEAEKQLSKEVNSRRRGFKDIDPRRLLKQQAKYEAFRSKWCLKSGKSPNWARISLVKHDQNECGSELKNSKHKLETAKSLPYVDSVSANAYMVIVARTDVSSNHSERYETEHFEDDDCSSQATDCSVQQEPSLGSFDEECSSFSHCSRMELDSLVISEDTYQPSPISVLEPPFSEVAINSIGFLKSVKDDIYDLGLQLELLRSETSETYSEGPGMAVSSDDECEEQFEREPAKENEKDNNFLYLVEVIKKASFQGKNLADFGTWASLETPISPSVFESLEKKYRHRVSWRTSERRLLFDRTNEGLVKILSPRVGVENSVSRRFSAASSYEMIGEDLWKLLVSQEKKFGLEQNVLGSEFGKLELGDEIDVIGQEIERLLFDEVLAEVFLF